MPKKEEGPLKLLSKEGDELKKKVEKCCTETQKLIQDTKSKGREKQLVEASFKLKQIEGEVDALLRRAKKLKSEDEPVRVDKFEEKKKDEVKRGENMKDQLVKLRKKLDPNAADGNTTEEHKNKPKGSQAAAAAQQPVDDDDDDEDDEDDDDEYETDDDDDDDDDDEYEDVTDDDDDEDEYETDDDEEESEEEEGYPAVQNYAVGTSKQYEAITDYDAQMPEDLSFKAGEILTIISARDDGWLEAKNANGDRGMVPSTFLRVHTKYKDFEEPDDDDVDSPDPKTPRSGRMLWKNISKAVNETSVTDVLHAMKAVPAGFRESTLAKLKLQDQYTLKNYLFPKLSASNVSYRDIFFDPDINKIRTRNVRIQRIVTLVSCRQMPFPGTGLEVKSRHVRICLFDGKNMLSNIHVVRVANVDKEQKTWNFNTKVTELMKSVEFGDFFVRSNTTETEIGILFELCVTYIRVNTGQEGEFSCGWVHVPLFEPNGTPAPNKTYEISVNGGTPYEKGVDVDPSVGRKAQASRFRALMAGNKSPRLTIRINAPSKDQKELLDTLPDFIVGSTVYIQYMSFYRQHLTDALLRDCMEPQSTELINNPLLSTFPAVAEQPDLMDVLRASWAEKFKMTKRGDKFLCSDKENILSMLKEKDNEALKELFYKVFMEQVYPLYHSALLPPLKFADKQTENKRSETIRQLQDINKAKKFAVAQLLSPDAMHRPFDIQELAFDITGQYWLG